MDSKQFRVLIYHCFLMSKNTVETREWLEKCYPDAAPSKSTVERWFSEFNRGRTDTDDAKRSGRPNRVVTPENIEKVKEIVAANRKAKLQDIADTLKISKGSVFTILQEHRAQTTDDGDGVVVDEEEVTAPDARQESPSPERDSKRTRLDSSKDRSGTSPPVEPSRKRRTAASRKAKPVRG